jgi:hypothetical protein
MWVKVYISWPLGKGDDKSIKLNYLWAWLLKAELGEKWSEEHTLKLLDLSRCNYEGVKVMLKGGASLWVGLISLIFWVTWGHKEVSELDIDLYNWCLKFSPYFDIWFIGFQFKTLFHVFFNLFYLFFDFLKASYTCLQHMHQKHEELLII